MRPPTMLKIQKKHLLALAVILALGLFLRLIVFGPPKVQVVRLTPQDLVTQIYGNGTVEAKVMINIAGKITARLAEVSVDQGDLVKRGQVLAKLDATELQAQAKQAAATAEKAAATIAMEQANLQKAQAGLLLAEKNSKRFNALAAKELVSAQEAEQYETAFLVAREEAARAAAALNSAGREKNAATAALAASRSRLDDTLIVAPEEGVIIRRELEPGATVTAGLPIFLLANPETVWVKANVDESLLTGVTPGQPATISLRSAPGEKFPGRVARLAWESDRVTESLEVDVAFTPALKNFHLGEQAEVLITANAKQGAMSLPTSVLVTKGNQRGVWTVIGNRLQFRKVVTGLENNHFVEITSGLTDQDAIAIAAPERLQKFSEGQKVRVSK
ncbi:MAG: efflux RND transporter periplasmic adaptor subunit [Desulfobulbaceae bacterium]|nr:efflux RND transporter periplasmic adaptor subunit [Desulfobulbaceae bacterium]HIJ90899.1 efflux RND transporter periplasmic adaptor subunit [Deltaproteobacteria bacterium]